MWVVGELYELLRELNEWMSIDPKMNELSVFMERLTNAVIEIEQRLDALEDYGRIDE